MRSSSIISASLAVVCFAFVGLGLAFAATCDGGYSLIFFGIGIAFLGALIYRMGAWATIIPFAIIALCLIGGGYYGLTVAGCPL